MSIATLIAGEKELSFDSILDAFSQAVDKCVITLNQDSTLDKSIEVSNIEVTLDLNGFKLECTHKSPGLVISNLGKFILRDSSDGKGQFISKDLGVTVGTPDDFDDKNVFTMLSGSIIAQEFGVVVYGCGIVNVYSGLIQGKDNAAISGNGSKKFSPYPYTINIFGGTLIGETQTQGYANCGLYACNSGYVNISGGTVKATDGAGIVIRGGSVNVSGGQIIGLGSTQGLKMGDATPTFCGGIEVCNAANYPGKIENCTVSGGTISSKTNGGIIVIGSPDNPLYENSKDSNVVVSGGVIEGNPSVCMLEKDGSAIEGNSETSHLTIYGGKFSSDISSYLNPDSSLKKVVNSDGTISYQVEKTTIDVIESLDRLHLTVKHIDSEFASLLNISTNILDDTEAISNNTNNTVNKLDAVQNQVTARLDSLVEDLKKVLDVTKKTLVEIGTINGDDLSSELNEDKSEEAIQLMQIQTQVNQAKLNDQTYIIWNHIMTKTVRDYCDSKNYRITQPSHLGGQYLIFIAG